MTLRLPGDIDFDLSKAQLQGVQLALGLEQLSAARKKRETEEQAGQLATESVMRTPVLNPVGDSGMSVNIGDRATFNPAEYINKLKTSGNPDLLTKAGEYEQQFASISETNQKVKKAQLENEMQDKVNKLNTLGMALSLAKDDPASAAAFINQSNIDDGDDKEQVREITPLGGGKYQIIGTDSNGKPMTQVLDETEVLRARTDANTQWTQYNENLRNQERPAADRAKEGRDKSGPEYIDVTAPDTGKEGRMKVMDMVDIYRKTHPTASTDDLEFLTAKAMAGLPGASEEDRAKVATMEAERGEASAKFAEWAWNTYRADPLGLINAKGPIPWMGSKLPPAGLMRGKALYDNKTRSWKISNGTEWLKPNEKQQKQIDAQQTK